MKQRIINTSGNAFADETASETANEPITAKINQPIAMLRAFKDHPESVGQNYFQHLLFSASVSMTLLYASLTALLHAIAPPICQTSTSIAINKLHARMQHQTKGNIKE